MKIVLLDIDDTIFAFYESAHSSPQRPVWRVLLASWPYER